MRDEHAFIGNGRVRAFHSLIIGDPKRRVKVDAPDGEDPCPPVRDIIEGMKDNRRSLFPSPFAHSEG